MWFILKGWLDDIGLPQYKDQFHQGRVDGRMLQYLTVVSTSIGFHRRLCLTVVSQPLYVIHKAFRSPSKKRDLKGLPTLRKKGSKRDLQLSP